jgi:hypothetical protein
MPTLLWFCLTALLYYRTSATCVALAEALETVSHDRLTRLLQADWSGQTLLEIAFRTLFVWGLGYLIIDDSVIAKPFATAIESLAWVFSSQERKHVSGVPLSPVGIRLWRKAGASKYALAWHGSVIPVIVYAVARSPSSLTPGILPRRCSNVCVTRGGTLSAA